MTIEPKIKLTLLQKLDAALDELVFTAPDADPQKQILLDAANCYLELAILNLKQAESL